MHKSPILRLAIQSMLWGNVLGVGIVPCRAEAVLPAPQLVQGGQMLLVGYEADAAAIRSMLPAQLEPLGNMVLMNMYLVPDGARTSGLGAYTLTYLTILVKGHDGYAVGSKDGLPGRYMTFYWNSSDSMRPFTRAARFPDDAGGSTTLTDDDSKVTTALTVNGQAFIDVSATLAGEWSAASGGMSNYLVGGKAQALGISHVPWVCSAKQTSNPSVRFSMPASHPAARLKPVKVTWAARMNCDFVYPQTVSLAK